VKTSTHTHLQMRSRIRGSLPTHPLYAFTTCYLGTTEI
jgi:hypothetical protein